MKQFQFVWWGWRSMHFGRSEALLFGSLRAIYDWGYSIGPVEVRKWKR